MKKTKILIAGTDFDLLENSEKIPRAVCLKITRANLILLL